MIGAQVTGMKELEKQLLELGAIAAGKVLVKAARKAFLPVLRDAQRRVRVDTGLLRDSIKISVKKAPKGSDAAVVVGLRIAVGKGGAKGDIAKSVLPTPLTAKGRKQARKAAWRKSAHWRWHFVEFGTKKVPAKPFLRPALSTNADLVLQTLKLELKREIDRYLKKRSAPRKAA